MQIVVFFAALWQAEDLLGLPTPGWTPWAVMIAFFAGLAGTVIWGLRAVITGQLVAKSLHQEVRLDRDAYRHAAETALAANVELAGNVRKLVTTLEQLMVVQEESQRMIRQLLARDTVSNSREPQ